MYVQDLRLDFLRHRPHLQDVIPDNRSLFPPVTLSNSFSRYGSVAKTFHWLTAFLILSAFPLGYFANQLAHQILSADFDGSQATITRATLLFSLHKTVGIAAFFVALLRILWAITQPKPGLLHPDNKPEALAAEVVHWILYGSLVAVPLTGWVHHAATTGFAPILWPFGQGLPLVPKSETFAGFVGSVHVVLVYTLLAALGLHVAGALKHHVIDRDSTLRRMLPGTADLPEPPPQSHSLMPAGVAALVFAAVLAGGSLFGFVGEHAHTGHDHSSHAHDHSHDHGDDHAAADDEERTVGTDGNWQVSEGTLGLTIQQMGSGVSGTFGRWAATINFDEPSAPGPAGSVEVEIDITSLSLGTVTDQAMGADYFAASTYPTARFEAEIEKLAAGYQAVGTLTIRDKTQPLTLPFDLTLDGDTASMSGSVTVNRMDYDVGLATKDAGSLGFEVLIDVALTAARQN